MKEILIVDYKMGNLGSIANMIKRIGYQCEITSDTSIVKDADKIILPGVGHFDKAMQNIASLGLKDIIIKKALIDKTPMLGICLGMQIMGNQSEEGIEKGLGIIDADFKKFSFLPDLKLKIPHMGWNTIETNKESRIFKDMPAASRFYFVHSFHAVCNNERDILTTTSYGYNFSSSFANENILGVQFHPEKSHQFGMQLLKNFIENF